MGCLLGEDNGREVGLLGLLEGSDVGPDGCDVGGAIGGVDSLIDGKKLGKAVFR